MLCDFKNGLWTGKKPPFVEARVLRNTNISRDGRLDLSNVALLQVEENQLKSRQLQPGDIILEKSGGGPKQPVGRVVLFNEPDGVYSFSNFTSVIRIRDRRSLLPEFLHWSLYSQYVAGVTEHMQKHTTGIRNLEFDSYKAIEVPLPPLAEQKRIVAILDEAFEGIAKATANAERNLANSEELFESQLQAIFNEQNGIDYALSDICSIESKLIDPKEAQFADLLHIGGGNMVTKSDSLIDLKTAKEEGLISSKFLFDAHTILYNKIRPYLMKVARPDFDGLCSADVYPLKPRKGILNRDYLFFLLLSKKFTNYAIEGSGRAGMPKVNRNHLFAYRVTLPDLDTQITSAARIDSTMNARSKLSAIYQAKLTSLQELKLALLHKAFSGQLTGKEAVVA